MLLGNDVSSWQGDINFDVYKNNANFVICKATEGLNFIDPKLSRNQSEARRVGLPLGYYHFARPSYGNDPAQEADFFLKSIGTLQEGEVLCLDYEDNYTGGVVDWCKNWLDRVQFMCGVKPLVYLNQSLIAAYNWQRVVDADYGLWVAAYTYDPNNNTANTGVWPNAAMQQWTDKQIVPGIPAVADGDVFFGDVNAFKLYGYHKPAPTPPPQPTIPLAPTAFENINTVGVSSITISTGAKVYTYTDKDIILDLGFWRVIKV